MKWFRVFVLVVFSSVAFVAGAQVFEDVTAENVVRSQTELPVFGGTFTDLDKDGDDEVLLFASPWSQEEIAPDAKDGLGPMLPSIAGDFDGDEDRDFVLADATAFADFSMDAKEIDVDGDGTTDLYLANRGQPDQLLLRRK